MSIQYNFLSKLPHLNNDQEIPPPILEAAGYSPAYVDENRSYSVVATAIALMAFDTCIVGLRFWSRWLRRRDFRWDDGLILAGLVFCLTLNATFIAVVERGGVGRHFLWILFYPDRTAVFMVLVYMTTPILHTLVAACSKLALLYIYQSVFINKKALLCCKILVGVVIASTIATVPVPIFQCVPIDALWDLRKAITARCLNKQKLFSYGLVPTIVTDIALIILPIPEVMRIQMSLRVRVGISALFMLGSSGLIVTITHMVMLRGQVTDPSWDGLPLFLLAMIEASVYLVSVCMLQFPPLLKYLFNDQSILRIIRSRIPIVVTSKEQTRTGEPVGNLAWNNSAIGLRVLPSKSESDDGVGGSGRTQEDKIVITSEFTVSYSQAETQEPGIGQPYDGIGLSGPPDKIRPREHV